jgi:hypothetical protein
MPQGPHPELVVLNYARSVAVAAAHLEACNNYLHQVTRDSARNARKDVAEAIARLRIVEQLMTDRVEREG